MYIALHQDMSIPSTPIFTLTKSTKYELADEIPDKHSKEEPDIHSHHRNHSDKTGQRMSFLLFHKRS
jgi:hypothetical protein